MTSIRGASVARNPPAACSACGVTLGSTESHVSEWRAGGLTYWCIDCDPRKAHA